MTATTPTGLERADYADLEYGDRVAVAEWMNAQRGEGGFLPTAIRVMDIETRLRLANDEQLTLAWQQREYLRCVASPRYLIERYGSIEPPRGEPIPFGLWDAQRDLLARMRVAEKLVIPKARRLGISWLALHYGLQVAGFEKGSDDARVLVLSKNLIDASKLLDRVKRINARFPPFLQLPNTGDDSKSVFGVRRAEIIVLSATPSAARQETARLVILDEFGFVRNESAPAIFSAVQATIEGGGQLFVVSTGNGRVGDGAEFARIAMDANSENNDFEYVFLPWMIRPDRTPEWMAKERRNYESDEAFRAEYPATLDEALGGARSFSVYDVDGIGAAQKIGAAIWEDKKKRKAILEQGIEIGTDWGDFQTYSLYAAPLPGGGVFIFDELIQSHIAPQTSSEKILRHEAGGFDYPKTKSYADASPAGTNAAFIAVLDSLWQDSELRDRIPESHITVPFSVYKQGGNERRGVNTVAFVQWLLERTTKHVAGSGTLTEASGVLAIGPLCKLFPTQMKNLERDPKTGKVRKPSLDPKKLEQGDHGPDAAIALLAQRAREWEATKSEEG